MTGRPEPCHPATGPIAPGRYLQPNGDGVVVPARIAAWLSRRARLDQLRIAARGMGDPELDAVLLAFRVAALTAPASSGHVATNPELDRPLDWVSCSGAATALDLTARAVRKACVEGRLTATKTDTGWRIVREDVEQFRATRRRRRPR